jgi:hypothetical protein
MNNVVNKPIVGQVAGIINERELAINIGSKNGVLDGMKFSVMAKEAIEVYDPETKEKLGMIDREKVRVMATEVKEKFSICKTYRKWASISASMVSIGSLFAGPTERQETLKVNDSSLPPPLSEEESYVKIGDRVIQIIEEADSR